MTKSRLIVITTPELEPGYRLAGVSTLAAASTADAAAALHELIAVEGEQGVIAVHEPFFNGLEEGLRRRLDELVSPLAIALPAGETSAAEEERHARLVRLLWQAVGYEITFEAEGRRSQ